LPGAHEHDHRTDQAHQRRTGETHDGRGSQSLQNVVEQALDAAREDLFFAIFRVIALHHAHAAKRFRQPAGDFGVDFWPCAEDRANC
jgi:hypothetical protein